MWSVRWKLPLIVQLKSSIFFRRPQPPIASKKKKKYMVDTIGYSRLQAITRVMHSNTTDRGDTGISFALLMLHTHTQLQNTNNLGQLFQIQLLWTWSQLVSGGGVCLAHTYQLGRFPKQYCTMLPRGLQQNKTLISLNVIVISYSSKKQHGYWGLGLEMSNGEQSTTRCLFGHLHTIYQINTQICCD